MSDLIERRAAIDVFEDTTFTKNAIRRRLSELPSAQLVLTCEGCKYDGYYKHMRCRNCLRKKRDLYEPE